MVQSEQVQNRGVQIVNVNGILDCLEAEIVGCAIWARLRSSAGQQDREAVNVVVPAVVDRTESAQVHHWRAPEFAADNHQRFFRADRGLSDPGSRAAMGASDLPA